MVLFTGSSKCTRKKQELTVQLAKAEVLLETVDAENDGVKNQTAACEKEKDTLTTVKMYVTQDLLELKEECDRVEQRREELSQENDKLKADKKQRMEENMGLQNETEDLGKEKEDGQKYLTRVVHEKEHCEIAVHNLKPKIPKLEEMNVQLENNTAALAEDVTELKEEVNNRSEPIQDLDATNLKLSQEQKQQAIEILELNERIAMLEEELEAGQQVTSNKLEEEEEERQKGKSQWIHYNYY